MIFFLIQKQFSNHVRKHKKHLFECRKKFKFLKTLRVHVKKARPINDAYQIASTKKLKKQ